jgi:hypothetical protein
MSINSTDNMHSPGAINCWHAIRRLIIWNIDQDNGISTNIKIVVDLNGACAYAHMISDLGRAWIIGPSQPHCNTVSDATTVTQLSKTAHHHAAKVVDHKIFT